MDPIEELSKVVVQGFASVNDKIDSLETKMDAGFARVDQDLAFVKRAILDHTRELREIRSTLDKKVDRDEVEALVERAVARAIGT